ncbi:MAG TPA: permease [Candidatus Deferrimicrobium sp.]|nr:permease [Candidatus Deferrimicrobium sp.]
MSGCCESRPVGGGDPGGNRRGEAGAAGPTVQPAAVVSRETARYFGAGFLALGIWWLVYRSLPVFSRWFTFSLIGLAPGSRMSAAVEFFVFDGPKVLLLLALVVFAVGIVRSFFTPERTRRILAGRRESAGNVLASLLGVVTPFCSCSAVPLFLGFVTSGVPLGVTFSFLVSAPMVNEVALVLLYGLFGWKVAVLYAATGLTVAMVSGWVIGRLGMEKHVEEWVYATPAGEGEGAGPRDLSWRERVHYGLDAVREIVGKVWPYVLAGIAVGAVIHGYVPENFMAGIMGAGAWWSVPLAVGIGIPMYSNAAGIIPIVQALLGKGAALGTVLAFMMSVIGLSLPEMIILRKVLKIRLIAVFAGVVGTGILIVGYLFNALL